MIVGKIAVAITGIVLLFSGGAPYTANTLPPTQSASAILAVAEIDSPPPLELSVASSTSTKSQAAIINNYITQPITERIVQTVLSQNDSGYVTQSELASQLAILRNGLGTMFYGSSYTAPASTPDAGIWGAIAMMGRIEKLKDTSLTTPTISSPNISGGSISGATVAGYFPLTGGTLTGVLTGTNLTLTGDLTVSGAQTLSGAITIPYLNATSTTATSTFAGGLSVLNFAQTGTATSTFANGLSLAGGCFAKSGSCLQFTDIVGTLGIAQGGTATSTQVTNGVNYFDGTRITSGTALTFDGTTLTAPHGAFSSTSGTTTIASGQGFTIGGSQFVLQQGSGNVGIGTVSAAAKLHSLATTEQLRLGYDASNYTSFTVNSAGSLTISPSSNVMTIDSTNLNTKSIITASGYTYGSLGIAYLDSAAGQPIVFRPGFTELMRISPTTGNVGISNTSPSYKLDVNGFINTDGTTGGYKLAGNTILYASSTTFSLGVGEGAGGTWISATSTAGLRSVAIGYQALNTTPTNENAYDNSIWRHRGRLASTSR